MTSSAAPFTAIIVTGQQAVARDSDQNEA